MDNQTPQAFFYQWAGYSYDPAKETPSRGRRRCASNLARAEKWASRNGFSFNWEVDPYTDSSEFRDDCEPYEVWVCCAMDSEGECVASCGCIDFGPGGKPWGDPYMRVMEAELACEAMGK